MTEFAPAREEHHHVGRQRSPGESRNSAMFNGALIALGVLGIIDNVLCHWILQLHRAVPGPSALVVELALVIVGSGLLMLGVWRELRERR